jgi:hypothetical protein
MDFSFIENIEPQRFSRPIPPLFVTGFARPWNENPEFSFQTEIGHQTGSKPQPSPSQPRLGVTLTGAPRDKRNLRNAASAT